MRGRLRALAGRRTGILETVLLEVAARPGR
jgi:hypothetical protein